MRVRVLGSAAGGGFPQWNCSCANCASVRAGAPGFRARTQDSIAVFDRDLAVLCNASPDIARQIEACSALQPRARRHTPIAAVVLTNGDLDHVLGLLSLREAQALAIYATAPVLRGLVEENAMCRTLSRHANQAVWRVLELDREIVLADAEDRPLGVSVSAHSVAGKPPAHLAGTRPDPGDNVALAFRSRPTGRSLVYAPNAAAPIDLDCDVLMFDGTFWTSDELVRVEAGLARAEDMAHLPVGGPDGSLVRMKPRARRKLYTHLNNTNPMLAPSSPERHAVERVGWEIAEDGLELVL